MRKLSTGDPSTLGSYLKLTKAVFGEGKAAAFIQQKIDESPNGENEEVLADEAQMLHLIGSMAADEIAEGFES